jgi:hypothetical protein
MVTPSPEAVRELTEKTSTAVTWLAEVLRGRVARRSCPR